MPLPHLDDRLRALSDALAHEAPPARVDQAIGAAIGTAKPSLQADRRFTERWLVWPVALAASIFAIAFIVRQTTPTDVEPLVGVDTLREARRTFMPLASDEEIARAADAYLLPARLPRTTVAQLGLPIDPQRVGEALDAELLVRPDGAVLALRFLD
ncbi:MAG TPA: hypothetical protein VNE58_11705 [Casimicrobiaceae bacterium]|nr:hypothetical protein [Casimicrobiaceae bacterium]